MTPSAVLCIVRSEEQALALVACLKTAHFFTDDISVLFADPAMTRHFAFDHYTKDAPGVAIRAATGGLVGGILGVLAGVGTVALPGLGLLVASGPMLVALGAVVGAAGAGGAAVGAAVGSAAAENAAAGAPVGGIAGALITLGTPADTARQMEALMSVGDILVSVHTRSPEAVGVIRGIYAEGRGRCICTTEQAEPEVAV